MNLRQRIGAPFFHPDQIDAMHLAFDRACSKMCLRGPKARTAIEHVAVRIVELARTGEFDPEKLTETVLADFAVGPKPNRSSTTLS